MRGGIRISERVKGLGVRAMVAARKGAFEEAERLAREGLTVIDVTDFPCDRADARVALAEVRGARWSYRGCDPGRRGGAGAVPHEGEHHTGESDRRSSARTAARWAAEAQRGSSASRIVDAEPEPENRTSRTDATSRTTTDAAKSRS